MRRNIATAAALLLGATLPLAAVTVELRPGILVDAAQGRAYVTRPGGGVEALSLESGQTLFTSDAGSRPLAVAGEWLVTLAQPGGPGRLDLALVPLDDPARVVTVTTTIPEDVWAIPVDGPGRRFEVEARARPGVLDLAWTFRWQRTSPIPPQEGEQTSGEAKGGVRISLAARTAEKVSWEEASRSDDGPVPPALSAFGQQPGPFGPPVKAGSTWAVVETIRLSPTTVRLVLRRVAADGTVLAAMTIFEGESVVQLPSPDSRHVLVGSLDERNPARYVWSLFSLETGAPAGVLGGADSHAFFSVLPAGNIAYEGRAEGRLVGPSVVLEKRALVVARPDGSVVFRREVRENEFRGPFAP